MWESASASAQENHTLLKLYLSACVQDTVSVLMFDVHAAQSAPTINITSTTKQLEHHNIYSEK